MDDSSRDMVKGSITRKGNKNESVKDTRANGSRDRVSARVKDPSGNTAPKDAVYDVFFWGGGNEVP